MDSKIWVELAMKIPDLWKVAEQCVRQLVYNPTTFSANPVSLVHLSNASAEATKAVRDELESPDFTEANNPKD